MLSTFYCAVEFVGVGVDMEDFVRLSMADLSNQSNGDKIFLRLVDHDGPPIKAEVISCMTNFEQMTCALSCKIQEDDYDRYPRLYVRYCSDGNEIEYALLAVAVDHRSPELPKQMQDLPYARNATKPRKDRSPA